MQDIIIRQAEISDADAVTELERSCFPESEAADRDAFIRRISTFGECFWVMEKDGRIVSMINGMTTNEHDLCDRMYEDTALYAHNGDWLILFGVATAPVYQRQKLASRLMYHVIEQAKKHSLGIVLTCKEKLLPFYKRFGFVNEGISASEHGGVSWYQMRLTFKDELFRCAKVGGEYSFYRNGRRYLLYGWKQCDGDYLNVSDENGNILWQSSIGSKAENAERFISEYLSDRFDF